MTNAEKLAALELGTGIIVHNGLWYADMSIEATNKALKSPAYASGGWPPTVHGPFDTEDEALDWLLEQPDPVADSLGCLAALLRLFGGTQ